MATRNLIGYDNDQVSLNGMLGRMAFQDSDRVEIERLTVESVDGAVSLAAISDEINNNAVDVFVYDTRKDSDGGAWRKRTQHTSWYNETLNTATRGSRREFPAVAVITVQGAGTNTDPMITIYDGDDPDLPMWMVFRNNITGGGNDQRVSTLYYAAGPYQNRKVSMLNGVMVDCQFRSTGHIAGLVKGVTRFNFIDDTSIMMTDEGDFKRNGNLGDERNTVKSYTKISTTTIVQTQCNDVAMTVLPNAPIDDATGLPIPTIAVATDGGVSVIKDDGTVVDITETGNSSYNYMTYVDFNDDNKLLFNYAYLNTLDFFKNVHVVDIPSADVSGSFLASPITALNGIIFQRYYSGAPYLPHLLANVTSASISNDLIFSKFDVEAGDYGGLTRTSIDYNSQSNSMVAYATTSYNTGWMHGDIKGAFLSDTDATNVTAGSNYVTNGTFDTDSDWIRYNNNNNWTISGGTASMSTTSSYLPLYQYNLGLTAGRRYVASVDVIAVTGQLKFDTAASDGGSIDAAAGVVITTTGTHTFTFTAESDQDGIGIARDASITSTCTIDNITIYELQEQDRSVNNKGLQVFGTITKSAVATGAELVAYSGFSSSNYLKQPYNSSLDVGTGDLTFMGWTKTTTSGNYELLFNYGFGLPNQFRFYITTTGDQILLQATSNNFSTYDNVITAVSGLTTWTHLTVIRKNLNNYQLYANGVLVQNSTLSHFTTFSNSGNNSSIYFGSVNVGSASNASMALWRISASVPSPEQIRKIYEDEKVLFQENAACTLYGSSDAVTALAYDDSTNLLYAGTSSGRSDFQGLRRINNTTTAVTTAISASNGLVAEQ